jgi:hypothetical protein
MAIWDNFAHQIHMATSVGVVDAANDLIVLDSDSVNHSIAMPIVELRPLEIVWSTISGFLSAPPAASSITRRASDTAPYPLLAYSARVSMVAPITAGSMQCDIFNVTEGLSLVTNSGSKSGAFPITSGQAIGSETFPSAGVSIVSKAVLLDVFNFSIGTGGLGESTHNKMFRA